MKFDTFAIVDWSGGNDKKAQPKADAIWAGVVRDGISDAPVYLRNRQVAEAWLDDLISGELKAGRKLCLGFDFPFGYPRGFAKALTGRADPFAVWQWLAERIEDAPNHNNRIEVAGQINAQFAGSGPFWANPFPTRDIPHLPRTKDGYGGFDLPQKRRAEEQASGAFTCWQLAGAGAVGSQVLMGLPVLWRLRETYRADLRVWPFEALDGDIAFVEVWPSLLADVVKAASGPDDIKDAVQVTTLAGALSRLSDAELAAMLDVDAPEEGWILGLGHEDILRGAAQPKTLRNDCFALPAGVHWTPVPEALDRLRKGLTAVVGVEDVPVAQSRGRVLARDHLAQRSNPPGANAAVDGYGFAYGAIRDPSVGVPLADGRAAAGSPFEGALAAGQAVRILTGALLPDGVDTVVLQEDCEVSEGRVSFPSKPKPGANCRKAGEDILAGDIALPKGHLMRPQDQGFLASVGLDRLRVHARLRVGVLSTGDELAAPGSTVDVARTYDANRPMLLSMAEAWGYSPVDLGHVGDDRAALRARLDQAAIQADVIFTSGGASAGEEDHLAALLQSEGAVQTWRIAIKPGRPLALALWKGVPIFGLPGNPVAAFVCALLFGRPALSVLAGGAWLEPQVFMVPAAFTKRRKPGRQDYLRARINSDGQAEAFQSEGSGRISGLSWAQGLVRLEDDGRDVAEGDMVAYLPFSGFGL